MIVIHEPAKRSRRCRPLYTYTGGKTRAQREDRGDTERATSNGSTRVRVELGINYSRGNLVSTQPITLRHRVNPPLPLTAV